MGEKAAGDTSQTVYTQHIENLQKEMAVANVDGFIIPVADEYQNEYPPMSARRVAWLCGFTGSAGVVVVLRPECLTNKEKKSAAIFVDGRYTLQARQQVDMDRYEQKDLMADPLPEWVADRLPKGAKLAYDPWLHTQMAVETMRKQLEQSGILLLPSERNLLDAVWKDRPAVPSEPVRIYEEEYAGESSRSKRRRIGKIIERNGVEVAVITQPDSIAWLLNIRGGDVMHTPLALSFALLYADGQVRWFIDARKLNDAVRAHLGEEVTICPMEALAEVLHGLSAKKVQYDPKRSAVWFHQQLTVGGAEIIAKDDPCLLPKACKNAMEITGMRNAHLRDGVALTRFLCWLDTEIQHRELTELEAEAKLLEFRQQQFGFHEPSFDTIAGNGAHGAIVHYRATPESNAALEKNSLFLLDSGGQYIDGTTDVTRTIAIGTPTAEQKRRFTQVLRGHIALAKVVFPKGVCGQHLDVLARSALWADGVDYAHGTGHGVGAYLGVHEGPQGIHMRSDVPLQPGMVLSNEPGFYKEGEYGIRIENLVVVTEKPGTGKEGSRPYYQFETLTMAPIDLRLVEPAVLTADERQWLNAYHLQVRDALWKHLDMKEQAWLEAATRQI